MCYADTGISVTRFPGSLSLATLAQPSGGPPGSLRPAIPPISSRSQGDWNGEGEGTGFPLPGGVVKVGFGSGIPQGAISGASQPQDPPANHCSTCPRVGWGSHC